MTDEAYNEAAAKAAAEGADRGNAEAEEQQELFAAGVIEGGGKTLKNLIKAGVDVKTTCALSRAEVPLRGGLPDPEKRVRCLVTGVFQSVTPLAERDDAGDPMKVTSWKARVNLRSDYVETVPDTDQGLITQRFKALAQVDPRAAGELLDALKVVMQEQLALA